MWYKYNICNFLIHFSVPPSLKELMDDLAPVSSRWFELGIYLDFSFSDLDVIKYNSRGSTSVCMVSMLEKKLQTSLEFGWSEVIQALDKMNERRLAERIKQKHYPQREDNKFTATKIEYI